MDERLFYEVGYHEVKGIKRIALPVRRLVRRVLRPIFVELDNRLKSLDGRQAQFDVHQNKLDQRQNELGQRENELDHRQHELDHRQHELDQRQNQLGDRQNQLGPEVSAATDRLHNRLDRELKALLALGWDHVAVTRRLAVLEDRVEALMSGGAAGEPAETCDESARAVIRYPGPDSRPVDDRGNRPVDVQLKAH
jgi:hypothetical protein